MTFSAVGSLRFKLYAMLLLVNASILGVSAHINKFQKFFYRADMFPFAMSIATMVLVSTLIFMDVKFKNIVTAQPPFELGWLVVLGALWLISNAFSTSRWRYVNESLCRTIPSDGQHAPYRTWCNELQALRVLVWIEWIMFFCIFTYLLRWAISQHKSGRRDVWTTAFSRFSVYPLTYHGSNSDFLQWEKFPQQPMAEPSRAGNQEFAQDPFRNDSPGYYGQHTEPQYNQSPEPQSSQSPAPQYPHFPETHSSQGPHPIEVSYTRHSKVQYIPPSQTQPTRVSHPYSSEQEHTL